MPTYDYVCEACGHEFEHFQSMGSRRLRKCPQCEQRKLIRLVGSGAGLIFKGSGFYETDYKRQGAARPTESESSSKSETAKSDAKKGAGKSGEGSGSGDSAGKGSAGKGSAGKGSAGKSSKSD